MNNVLSDLANLVFPFLASLILATAFGAIVLWLAYAGLFAVSSQWWMTMLISYGGFVLASYLAGRLTPLVLAAVTGRYKSDPGYAGLFFAALLLFYGWYLFLNPNPFPLKTLMDMKKYLALQALALIFISGPIFLMFSARRSITRLKRMKKAS